MKKLKRFLLLSLCVIGCFAFAACGGDNDDDSSKSNTNAEQENGPGDDAGADIYD